LCRWIVVYSAMSSPCVLVAVVHRHDKRLD
jgi:hypothetical protein